MEYQCLVKMKKSLFMKNYLRRYTDLPFLLDYLRTKELVLLSPKTWDDKNDSHYLESYAKASGFASTYALCLTEASETYHHWKVFTSGSSGVCIEFKKDDLIKFAEKVPSLRAESVRYRTIKALQKKRPTYEELPFLKRNAFSDELEFRLFLAANNPSSEPLRFHVPTSAVNRVVLSPWIPDVVAEQVKATLNAIVRCKTLKVKRSSLVNNEDWKRLAEIAA